MKKILYIAIFISLCFQHKVFAQFSSYSKYDNVEKVAFQVEDLGPEEIKTYNFFIENGMNNDDALLFLNAGRAHTNLQAAPPTIIDFHFHPEITEEDSIPAALGACDIFIELINTTPKTISEITFEFEFENSGGQVYDIKTGDKNCILKFKNLKGRTNSNKYSEIRKTIFDSFHILSISDASYKKLFYNKKATTAKITRCLIKYNDGTSSNKVALFNSGYASSDGLFREGPLNPLLEFTKKLREEK